jgi:hypothetical protein
MRGETQVRRVRESEWRYYRNPGHRDGRCSSGGWRARADAVEALVLDHLAALSVVGGLVLVGWWSGWRLPRA